MITTHYIDEAEKLCDKIYIMDQGRTIKSGTPEEIILNANLQEKLILEIVDTDCISDRINMLFTNLDKKFKQAYKLGAKEIVFDMIL